MTFSAIDCGAPLIPANTLFNYTNSVYLSVVRYDCKEGFKPIDGNALRVCKEDKQWNGTALVCDGML